MSTDSVVAHSASAVCCAVVSCRWCVPAIAADAIRFKSEMSIIPYCRVCVKEIDSSDRCR